MIETIDDDEDILVIEQIKAVSTITKAQALKIKEDLLGENVIDEDITIIGEISQTSRYRVSINNSEVKINNGDLNNHNGSNHGTIENEKKLQDKEKVQETSTPRKKRKSSVSPGKTDIRNYFTPTKESPIGKSSSGEKSNSSPASSSSSSKKIKLSPNILRRSKKFKLNLDEVNSESNGKVKNSPSPKKRSPNKSSTTQNVINSIPGSSKMIHDWIGNPPLKEEIVSENISNLSNPTSLKTEWKEKVSSENNSNPSTSKTSPKEKRLSENSKNYQNENSKLNGELFAKIIHDEMKKQLVLEENSKKENENFERLLLPDEFDIIDKFFKLEIAAQQLFVRIYGRQHKDHYYRLCNIKYDEISRDLLSVVNILRDNQFFETNVEGIDLVEQLNLLKKSEVQVLCKGFNLNLTVLSNAKKEVLIEKLMEDNKRQKSVLDMMRNNISNGSSRLGLLKAEVKKLLGPCFKLNEKVVETFNRIVLLYSLVHTLDDESNRIGDTLYFLFRIHVGQLNYLNYQVSPIVIFKRREDLLKYEKALELRQQMEAAIAAKNFENFDAAAKEAKKKFQKLLKDDEYLSRYGELKPFLKRYSAGSVYASILTSFCDKFKTKTKKKEVIEIGTLLLEQNYFGLSKKGKWYESTSQAYESLKHTALAGKLLIVGLKDENLSEIVKLTLQLRGKSILKRKTNVIEDVELKEYLEVQCTTTVVPEPLTREINARALEGMAGFKSVYVLEHQSGTSYSSVEEQALYHYKREDGFEKGIHAEGMLMHTIYFLLFFDIIYETSPPGVFQSPYQETPLDFASSSFYTNREDIIEARLEEMNFWTFEEILTRINRVYYENFNKTCCVSWKEEFPPELFWEIIKCMGVQPLIAICRRLVKNFRVFRSGFPDLTLWNNKTKKIKFVEVKSPNDRLAPNQRIWLNFLKNIGLDCEVCNVKKLPFAPRTPIPLPWPKERNPRSKVGSTRNLKKEIELWKAPIVALEQFL